DKYLRSFELGLLDKSLLARPLQLLSGRRRYRDAQRIISKLAFGAEDGPLAKLAVEICLHTGDVKRATELFSIAAARPDSKEVHDWLWTAGTAAALGDRSRAESALAKARELAPTKPEPWTLSVRFLAATGRKDEAKKMLEEASKKFPATETDLPFGLCLHALGESVEGDRRLEAALAKRPDDAGTLRAIAEFRIAENDFAKGRPLLERIVRVAKPESPDVAWAQRLLAVASATTGVGEARVAALKALGIAEGAGDSVTAGTAEELRVRAAVLASIPGFRRRKEAVAIFERLSAESGFSKADELVLCSLYESVGDWPAAKSRLLGIARSAGAPSAAALSALVRGILSRDRDAKAAEPWLARLERESPKSAAIVPLRALALKLGSGESAAETYVRAEVAEKLDSPEAAADLLIGIGARDAAERILRTASAGGNKPEASRRLAELVGARGRTAEALEICKGLRGKLPPLVVAQSFVIALNAADSVSTIDAAEFESWLERSLAKPEEADAKALFLAFLRTKQGRFADAMKLYQEILRRVPTHQMALNNGGFVAAFGLGDPVEGERMVDLAIAAYGVQPSLANTRGVIRLKLAATKPEKLADAIDDLSESVRMKPSGETSFQLARASLMAGKDKEARERWSEVLATGLTPYEVNDAFRAEFKSLMQRFK
ncbi:MAG TPA: tetratricopeptide repeat protein, partial [Planctomycetia bacterium]|nr:tetratricopeptide repeat protein [Planctomycetia bacterium]